MSDAGAGARDPRVADDELDPSLRAWLAAFERARGRPLRVLHLGNVANNAYLNARFLRRAGIEADVLSQSYHVISSPEWEDADLRGSWGDDFAPRWHALDLGGYERPRWFAQGPMPLCVSYLDALHGGSAAEARVGWRLLEASRRLHTHPRLWRGARAAWGRVRVVRGGLRRVGTALRSRSPDARASAPAERGEGPADRFVRLFALRFPWRPDRLTAADLADWLAAAPTWRRLFRHYDVVQGYATEAIWPLVAGGPPYVAYEHGTLRVFTMEDDPLHRLTSLAYREAGHVFITNGDCLEYAKRLGIERFSPMLHPVDVEQHEAVPAAEVAEVRRRYDADVLLLCPLRHDWQVKGTDVHLRALPRLRERVSGRVRLLLCRWGAQVVDSEALLAQLGCADAVHWLRPLARRELIRHMKAADVVLDQMALPHFGATAPQALAAGTPVVMSYRPESTAWIVPEPAPILAAFTPEQVADAVARALDPAEREALRRSAADWVHRYHHPRRVVRDHLDVYRRLLSSPASETHLA